MAALDLRYAVGLIVNNLVQFSVLITKLQGILMLWKLNQEPCLWHICKEKNQDKKEAAT